MGFLGRHRQDEPVQTPAAPRPAPAWAVAAGYGSGPNWARDAFGGLRPLPCVRGVMHHQNAIAAIGEGMPFDAILRREPANPDDAHAIAVGAAVGGAEVALGHVARDLAAYLAPILDAQAQSGSASMHGVPGLVVGGPRDGSIPLGPDVTRDHGPDDGARAYGVRLWLNHPATLDALGLDLERLTELSYT